MKDIIIAAISALILLWLSAAAEAAWLIDHERFHVSVHGPLSCQGCHSDISEKNHRSLLLLPQCRKSAGSIISVAGGLYVTCQAGRNGRMGNLLGAGLLYVDMYESQMRI